MLLTEEGKKDFLRDTFHQYFDITVSDVSVPVNSSDFVNFVLRLSDFNDFHYDIQSFKSLYLNNNCNNVIFTQKDNSDIIYDYEFYKGSYFIRIRPFSRDIRMHIIPKKYDASNTATDNPILFFKDEDCVINKNTFSCSEEYIRKTDRNKINLYYQLERKKNDASGTYLFDIREFTKNMNSLQINCGYSYNNTNPTNNIWHLLGILDLSDQDGNPAQSSLTEYNKTLIDLNADNVLGNTNNAAQVQVVSGEISLDVRDDVADGEGNGFSNPHSINTIYHKTIKYSNDDIYAEEDDLFYMCNWEEDIKPPAGG